MPKQFKAVLVPQSQDPLANTTALSKEFRKILSQLAQQHLQELADQQQRFMTISKGVPVEVQLQLETLRSDIAVLRNQVSTPMSPPGNPMMISDSFKSNKEAGFKLPGEAERTSDESEEEEDSPVSKSKSEGPSKPPPPEVEESRTTISKAEIKEEKSPYYKARDFFSSAKFDLFIGFLVLLNVFFMFLKCHYDGMEIGYELQQEHYPNGTLYEDFKNWQHYPIGAEEQWPGAGDILITVDTVFSLLFTVDVSLKIVFLGIAFWQSALNLLDLVVVVLGIYALASPTFNNPSYMRMLRLAKIGRLAGALKNSPAVQSLQMLLKCISNCVHTLGWSLCVLVVIQSIMGLFISSVVQNMLTDSLSQDPDIALPMNLQNDLFYWYGTFSKTMMTMFQILFANWIPCARILIDNVSEVWALFFICYRCLIGFAVLNVIKAVFVQSTMKVAQQDQELLIAQKQRQNEANQKNLKSLFSEIDESGDGEVSYEELMAVVENPKMKLWMSALEIDTHDLQSLFKLLDDGDGNISIDEFLKGIGRLKGPAKAIDLATLLAGFTKMQKDMGDMKALIKRRKM
mmetsp:Transcript_809/g.1536  ORF Transcript_809/g.1536 Transcript_809/m.1536 type:complete len:572 (+) Transcript_809:89-1804(+)